MNALSYPFDSEILIRKKRRIKRELMEYVPFSINVKIAILGGSTTDEIKDQLELFLLNYGIEPVFYQSEYGKYWEDAVFCNETLDVFKPDIVIIHTNWRNITQFPNTTSTQEEVLDMLEQEYQKYQTMWESIAQNFQCTIIQNNFDKVPYRLLGNKDAYDYRGAGHFIYELNRKFYEYANNHDKFFINDIDYVSSQIGIDDWNDATYWHNYKYAMSLKAIPSLSFNIANIIKSLYGKNKKMLVLDLDNTLWGGVIGDDGVDGIAVGPEVPQGQIYSEFQQYCKKLQQIGVVLAIDSKNDMDNAIAGLKHPYSLLKPEDFVVIKANWNPKDQNIKEIADEMSLGSDSFVFVDDNPAERAIVEGQIKGIAVPSADDVNDFIRIIDHNGYFETTILSNEDINKTGMYRAKAEAANSMKQFADYSDYLKSLQMKAVITPFKPIYIQRIAQLTNKSNQFNLTSLRCSEKEIQQMSESDKYICLISRLIDKFNDNGIVTVVAGEIHEKTLYIRLWLMSCRVLKRGLEDTVMNYFIAICRQRGITEVVGHYYPTAKNAMVKDFYGQFGFKKIMEDDQNNTTWLINVADYKDKDIYMEIEEE